MEDRKIQGTRLTIDFKLGETFNLPSATQVMSVFKPLDRSRVARVTAQP